MLIRPETAIMAFIATYFSVYWFLVLLEKGFVDNTKKQIKKWPRVTIAIPAYNEEEHVLRSVKSVRALKYPADKLEIFVIDDGSTDRTVEVVEEYLKECKDGPKTILLKQIKNQGKAAVLNRALKEANGEIFVCLDADSSVREDALQVLVPNFEGEIAAVLPVMKPMQTKNWLQKLQRVEYMVNHLLKKLVGSYDCIPVTPGPFSCYRTEVLRKIGGYDIFNLTEDMEIALRIQKNNYKILQVSGTEVYTDCPKTLNALYKQRNRWYTGTVLNLIKHKDMIFNSKYGELGVFYLPFGFVGALISIGFLYFIVWDQMVRPLINKIQMIGHVRYDVGLFFNRWFETFRWIDVDYLTLFLMSFFILFTLYWIFISHKAENEKYNKDSFSATILYLSLYPLFLSIAWLGVIVALVQRKRRRW